MDDNLRQSALDYHRLAPAGKIRIGTTKPLADVHDLSLAYSPGVAAACEAIATRPQDARLYTGRANLVGVITDGTAVLGLGNIGPLASKPVMEGKAALFRRFAGIDAFDLELNAGTPALFCDAVAALEPTFGGINLEDIRSPECFGIEAELRRRMDIPVFHDDQHGTAVACAAAVISWLRNTGRRLGEATLVTAGAGAAALACVDLLTELGLAPEAVTLTDVQGVVWDGRERGMPSNMARYARRTAARTLPEVLAGADIFLGLSAPRVLRAEWLHLLAPDPLILAMANPEPEIRPEEVALVRPDATVATGRSDYPNQVNNVLCFPYIFRGALDADASTINEEMKLAAAHALASLAGPSQETPSPVGAILPGPFDRRLLPTISSAVAAAADRTGVARSPVRDLGAYTASLAALGDALGAGSAAPPPANGPSRAGEVR